MNKKDVIIFLHIYLTNIKGVLKKHEIDDFRESVYKCLQNSLTVYDFFEGLRSCKICCDDYIIYRNFLKYLSRVKSICYFS